MTTSSSIKSGNNKKHFHNKPKNKKGKTQPQSSGKVRRMFSSSPTKEYLCKVCDNPVLKKNPCGSELVAATKHHPAKLAGLGKFKCICGNNKVYVKKVKVADTPELQKAA